MNRLKWLAAALSIALAGPAAAQSAQSQTSIGVLTCTLAETGDSVETPPSQSRTMLCGFKPTGTGPEERYSGEIRKVGTDTALTGKQVLIWAVIGPSDHKLSPGVLEQTYVGELAPPTDATGPQKSKMLIGKTDQTFALSPMSDKHENAAGSVTFVVLKMKSTSA